MASSFDKNDAAKEYVSVIRTAVERLNATTNLLLVRTLSYSTVWVKEYVLKFLKE